MADLKLKYDTETSLLSTGLNSLAASATAGFASVEVDNTTNLYVDVLIVAQFVWSTGTPTGPMELYALGSKDGTIYSGDTSYSGTAAAYTLAQAGSPNLAPLGIVHPIAASSTRQGAFLLSGAFNGRIPPFWAIVCVNNTAATALAASGSTVKYSGIWYQSV
jgi:hypothetical protein